MGLVWDSTNGSKSLSQSSSASVLTDWVRFFDKTLGPLNVLLVSLARRFVFIFLMGPVRSRHFGRCVLHVMAI